MTPYELLDADFTTKRRFLTEVFQDSERWYRLMTVFDPQYSQYRNDIGFGDVVSIINTLRNSVEYHESGASSRLETDKDEINFARKKREKGCFE